MFWDQWDFVQTMTQAHNRLTISQLWAPHNEHRILIGRLLCLADLTLFRGRNIFLLSVTFLVQSLTFVLYSGVVLRWGNFRRGIAIAICGFIAYCCFSPLQIKNFVWAFQAVFVPVYLGAAITFLLAVRGANPALSPRPKAILFAGCILAAAFTEATVASGLLVWPTLLILLFLMSAPRSHIAIAGIAMLVGFFAYFWHYPGLGHNGASNEIPTLIRFLVTEVAFSWDATLPNHSFWPAVSESLSVLAIALVLIFVSECFRRKGTASRLDQFLCGNLIFLLLTLGSTAVGRTRFGLDAATESRYQSFALVFWACVAIVLARKFAQGTQRYLGVAIALFGCVLLLSVPSRYPGMMAWALAQREGLAHGWNALMQSSTDDSAISMLYYNPTALRKLFAYLRANHWGPEGLLLQSSHLVPETPIPVIGFSTASATCEGFVDKVTEDDRTYVSISGWAVDKRNTTAPVEVAIISSTGEVLTRFHTGVSRPDVSIAHPEFHSDNTGWLVNVNIPSKGKYYAFVLREAGRTACELANGVAIVSR